ncbi:MAG: branched-chain amino acid ABC transporter permease, partial [Actinomycetota bacterium]|nr:branched-chain amino acid ABC transporter permease [Actinomycetota bacterium]
MEGYLAFGAVLLTSAAIYGLLTLALNLHYGYAGLLNFGHVAFFAAGAFASAWSTLPPPGSPAYAGGYQIGLGLPVAAGLVAGGLAGGALALLIGVTSVRLGGHYLAIATFALAETFVVFLSNEEWLTRGEFGISTVPRPFASQVSGTAHLLAILGFTLVVVIVGYLLLKRAT